MNTPPFTLAIPHVQISCDESSKSRESGAVVDVQALATASTVASFALALAATETTLATVGAGESFAFALAFALAFSFASSIRGGGGLDGKIDVDGSLFVLLVSFLQGLSFCGHVFVHVALLLENCAFEVGVHLAGREGLESIGLGKLGSLFSLGSLVLLQGHLVVVFFGFLLDNFFCGIGSDFSFDSRLISSGTVNHVSITSPVSASVAFLALCGTRARTSRATLAIIFTASALETFTGVVPAVTSALATFTAIAPLAFSFTTTAVSSLSTTTIALAITLAAAAAVVVGLLGGGLLGH